MITHVMDKKEPSPLRTGDPGVSRHVADAAGAGFLGGRGSTGSAVSNRSPPFLPSISAGVKSSTETAWRRDVLIGPLEEAALLVPRFPTGMERAALVRAVLLHRAGHGRVVAVAHGLSRLPRVAPSAASGGVPEPQRGPGRLRQRGPSALLRRPLLARLVRPQEEAAGPGAALVELPTLVGAVLAHGQEESVVTTVAHDGVAAGVDGNAGATWWGSRLRSPSGNRREGRSSGWLWSRGPWRWRIISSSSSSSFIPPCSVPWPSASSSSEVLEVQHLSERLVAAADAAEKFQRHYGRQIGRAHV